MDPIVIEFMYFLAGTTGVVVKAAHVDSHQIPEGYLTGDGESAKFALQA